MITKIDKYSIQTLNVGSYNIYSYIMSDDRLKLVNLSYSGVYNQRNHNFIHSIIEVIYDILDTYGNIEDIFLPLIDDVSEIYSIDYSFTDYITVFFKQMINSVKYKEEIEQVNNSLSSFGLTIFECETNYLNIRLL